MNQEQELQTHLTRLQSAQNSYHAAQGEFAQWAAMRKAMDELAWMEAHHIDLQQDAIGHGEDLQVHPDYAIRVDPERARRDRIHADSVRAAATKQF